MPTLAQNQKKNEIHACMYICSRFALLMRCSIKALIYSQNRLRGRLTETQLESVATKTTKYDLKRSRRRRPATRLLNRMLGRQVRVGDRDARKVHRTARPSEPRRLSEEVYTAKIYNTHMYMIVCDCMFVCVMFMCNRVILLCAGGPQNSLL